jgi:hypothetical protein
MLWDPRREQQLAAAGEPDYTDRIAHRFKSWNRRRMTAIGEAGAGLCVVIAAILTPNPPLWWRCAAITSMLFALLRLGQFHNSCMWQLHVVLTWRHERETAQLLAENSRLAQQHEP